MMNLAPLRELVRKDLLVTRSDRRAVILLFIAPIALASFMAAIMGSDEATGSGGVASRMDVVVTDEDGSTVSKAIVDALRDDENLKVEILPAEAAREQVRRGKATVGIEIPRGFGDEASRALFQPTKQAKLRLIHDPTHAIETGMVQGILTQHVMKSVFQNMSGAGPRAIRDAIDRIDASKDDTGLDRVALKTMLSGIAGWYERNAESKTGEKGNGFDFGMRVPFEAEKEAITRGGNAGATSVRYAHAFAGMAVQFILFSSIEAGVALLTERQKGLWKRVRATPISRYTLLASRAISGAIVALTIALVVMGFGMAVYGFSIGGSVLGFLLVAIGYAASAATFGLVIATLGKTPQAARGLSVLVVLLMVLLGGAWMPTFLFPKWLQGITPIFPTRWAVDGFDGTIARGYTLVETLPIFGALMAFSAAFALIALWRFQWEAD